MNRIYLFLIPFFLFESSLIAQDISDENKAKAEEYLIEAAAYRSITDRNFVLTMGIRDTLNQKSRREISTTTYIRFGDLAPMILFAIHSNSSDNGSLILQKDSSMWHYRPDTQNSIRISPSWRLLGEVSYADISTIDYGHHYDVTTLEETILGSTPVYLLHLTKKNKGATYSRIQYYLSQFDRRPVKSEFFSESGELLKTMYFHKFREIGVKTLMSTQWIIVDGLNPEIVTYLDITDIQYHDIPENYFQESFLPSLIF